MNITIIFGGSSYEHEVSIVSAITMKKVLPKANLKFVFVAPTREFYLIDSDKMKSKLFSTGEYKKSKKLTLKQGDFYADGMLGSKAIDTGVALNLIHGRDGEDGKMPAILSFYNIPFISPRTEASALSYNKLYTKYLADSVGVKSVAYEHLNKNDERIVHMDYPVIIKPVRLGSSIGLSIASNPEELDYALDIAFEYDSDVIIEKYIKDVKEYNQAGAFTDKWELSLIEEPQKDGFLDFDKKYMDFSRDEQINEADISDEVREKIVQSFQKIYDPLFLGSIVRCDFFVIDDEIYLNEINPVPGSMANYLFDDFEGVIDRLARTLPKEENIIIDYKYIDSIQKAKGKA